MFDEVKQEAEQSPDNSMHQANANYFFRLILVFIVVVITTFIGVETWRITRDYYRTIDAAHDVVTNLARATAQNAEDAIRQVDSLTAGLGERLEGDSLENVDVPRIHDLMKQQVQILPQLHGLFLYDAQGNWTVTDKDTIPENANNAGRDYFIYHKEHLDKSARIGPVIKSRSTNELVIPISRRVNKPDGSFGGVLLGTLKLNYFVSFYGEFKIDEQGVLVLSLLEGRVLARRPFDESIIGKSLLNGEIYKNQLPYRDFGATELKSIIDGTDRLIGFRKLSTYPIVVQAGLSTHSILEPWKQDLVRTGIILLILLAGMGVFGIVVLRQLRYRMVMEKELREAHQTVKDMSLTDGLTGLGNRRRLDSSLGNELSRSKREKSALSVIMLDIDNFKRFNDKYGHPAGDECLREVAQAIQACIKRPGDIAARYGGEEFTVLLPNTNVDGAGLVADNILSTIRSLSIVHAENPPGVVTASAGVMTTSNPEETASSLIKSVDAYLYVAKQKGRDRWYSPLLQDKEQK